MKKIVVYLLIFFVLAFGFFALTACTDGLPDNSAGVEITLIILDGSGENVYQKTQTSTKSSLFEGLKDFEEIQISAISNYLGAYINSVSIGTIEESEYGSYFSENLLLDGSFTTGAYISVYHDIDNIKYKDLSSLYNLEYAEKTYFYSGVSVSALPLLDKSTYILKLVKY